MKRACFERSKTMVDQLRQAGYPLGFDPAVMGEQDAISLRLPTGNWVMISVPEEGPLKLTTVVAENLPRDCGQWLPRIPVPVLGNDAGLTADEEYNAILEMTREGDIVAMVEWFQAGVETCLVRIFRAVEEKASEEQSYGETVYRFLRDWFRREQRQAVIGVRWNGQWEFSFDFDPGARWESLLCVTAEGCVRLEMVITGDITEEERLEWLEAVNRWNEEAWLLKLHLTEEGLLEGYVDLLLIPDHGASEQILTRMMDHLPGLYQDCMEFCRYVQWDKYQAIWNNAPSEG